MDEADRELAAAMTAVKAARALLGEHWIATSHLAEAFADLYHARSAISRDKIARIRLGAS